MFETIEQLKRKQKQSNNRTVEKRQKQSFKKPIDAIRAKCLQCSNGIRSEVENCPIIDCPLWSFRRKPKELPSELEDLEII